MIKIPVLMYHALESSEHPTGITDEGERVYVLDANCFEDQMRFLYKKGYQTSTVESIQAKHSSRDKTILLTFDDGRASDCSTTLPILKEFGFRAYFFITTDWIDKPGYLSKEQIKEIHDSGMIIGSHSVTHSYLEDLSDEHVLDEMICSKNILDEITGEPIQFFSAPGGRIRPNHEVLARQVGYRSVFTSQFGTLEPGKFSFLVPRIAIKRHTSHEDFVKIVYADSFFLVKSALSKKTLDFTKKVIGNRGYDRLREQIFKLVHYH